MRKVKDFQRGKDFCVDCYYADPFDFGLKNTQTTIMCKLEPTKVIKLKDQWCGQFVPYDDSHIL